MRMRTFIDDEIVGPDKTATIDGVTTIRGTALGGHVSDVMIDVVIKDFYKLRNQGVIFNNPMTRITSSSLWKFDPFSFEEHWSDGTPKSTRSFTGFTFGEVYPELGRAEVLNQNQPIQEDLGAVALLACQSNIDKSTYNFAEDIAEVHKTIATLRGIFGEGTNTFTLLRGLIDKKLRSGLGWDAALAAAWLECRYAFRPILISLYNLSEMIETNAIEKTRKRPERRRARGRASGSSFTKKVDTVWSSDVHWTETHTVQVSDEQEVGCLYVQNRPANPILQTLGLRLRDVPATMWAIMPYSWVVDHFWNIQKYITAEVTLHDPGITILTAWSKSIIRTQDTRTESNILFDEYASRWNSVTSSGLIMEESIKQSVVRSAIPIDAFLKARPTLHVRFDLAFMADLFALLIGFAARR